MMVLHSLEDAGLAVNMLVLPPLKTRRDVTFE